MKTQLRTLFAASLILWHVTLHAAATMGFNGLSPEVHTWMQQVTTNYVPSVLTNGQYTSLSLVANDTWIKLVKSGGLRTLIYRANTYTGKDVVACVSPLIHDRGTVPSDAWTGVASNYSEATGLTGHGNDVGARRYLDTTFVPATHWDNATNLHTAAYCRTDSVEANNCLIGATLSGSGPAQIYLTVRISLASNTSYGILTGNNAAQTAGADPNTLGFYFVSRASDSSLVLYKNGVSIASNGGASGTLLAPSLYVHAVHDSVLGDQIDTTKALGGYSIGTGMTAAQAAYYNYCWKRKETILGRAVP